MTSTLNSHWEVLSSWLFLAQFLPQPDNNQNAHLDTNPLLRILLWLLIALKIGFASDDLLMIHQHLLAHLFSFLMLFPKITVNSCQSEALPISSDSWYPLLLSCSVVPHMLSLCLHISRRCQSSEVLYNCNLSRWVCLSLSSIAATLT